MFTTQRVVWRGMSLETAGLQTDDVRVWNVKYNISCIQQSTREEITIFRAASYVYMILLASFSFLPSSLNKTCIIM